MPQTLPEVGTYQPPVRTPYTILDEQQQSLQEFYGGQEQLLKGIPMTNTQYSQKILGLQQEYDQQKMNVTMQRQRLDGIKKFVNQGVVTPEHAEQAMWATVLPDEQVRALYPAKETTKEPDTPFSPDQLRSNLPTMIEFASSAEQPSKSLKFGFPGFGIKGGEQPRTRGSLLTQYISWRSQIGYDNLSSIKQHQLDQQWDALMKGGYKDKNIEFSSANDWDPKSVEVQAWRTKGPLMQSVRKTVTPFGASLITAKPKEKTVSAPKQVTPELAQQLVQEAGGDRNKARELARKRGYTF